MASKGFNLYLLEMSSAIHNVLEKCFGPPWIQTLTLFMPLHLKQLYQAGYGFALVNLSV